MISLLLAMLFIAAAYVGYWTAWCWVWHYAWPSGPQWLIRPHVSNFLLVNITGLILILVICSRASE